MTVKSSSNAFILCGLERREDVMSPGERNTFPLPRPCCDPINWFKLTTFLVDKGVRQSRHFQCLLLLKNNTFDRLSLYSCNAYYFLQAPVPSHGYQTLHKCSCMCVGVLTLRLTSVLSVVVSVK